MIVAGIDEAGLGPVLGPLVVSGVALRIDTHSVTHCVGANKTHCVGANKTHRVGANKTNCVGANKTHRVGANKTHRVGANKTHCAGANRKPTGEMPDLWAMLSGAVSKKTSRKKAGSITIGDSKKLYNRKKAGGLIPLERGVLTMLSARTQGAEAYRKIPANLAELLGEVDLPITGGCGVFQRAKQYDWYGTCDLPLPLQAQPIDIELAGNSVLVAMRKAGVELLDMRSQPVFTGDFNQMIAATQNKSTTVLDVTLNLLMWLWNSVRDNDLRIIVDRQGGRVHYRTQLQRVFPDCNLKILEESEKRSAYQLQAGVRTIEVSFVVGGEAACLATALASMLSKYLRELFMEMFNRYWMHLIPDLKATAGYYVDGNRFYGEIAGKMRELGVAEDTVLRCR